MSAGGGKQPQRRQRTNPASDVRDVIPLVYMAQGTRQAVTSPAEFERQADGCRLKVSRVERVDLAGGQ